VAVLEASASRSVASRRRVVDPTRPGGRGVPAAGRHLAPVACGHRRAPVPLSLVIALGLAVCLAVIGLGVLANLGAGAPAVPARTAVVRVEPGENLQELAQRVAPGSDPSAVVDRIMELNGLTGVSVRAGQPLTVPVGK
jgi:hypothetical protein